MSASCGTKVERQDSLLFRMFYILYPGLSMGFGLSGWAGWSRLAWLGLFFVLYEFASFRSFCLFEFSGYSGFWYFGFLFLLNHLVVLSNYFTQFLKWDTKYNLPLRALQTGLDIHHHRCLLSSHTGKVGLNKSQLKPDYPTSRCSTSSPPSSQPLAQTRFWGIHVEVSPMLVPVINHRIGSCGLTMRQLE